MNTTGSANLAAIPIACLLAAGVAVFLIAAKVNRPYLIQKAQEEQASADTPDTSDAEQQS